MTRHMQVLATMVAISFLALAAAAAVAGDWARCVLALSGGAGTALITWTDQ